MNEQSKPGRLKRAGKPHGFAYIAFWQFLAFLMLGILVWLNEVTDFAHLFFDSPITRPNVFRGCVMTAAVILVAIISVGHTYLQQRQMISGLITICSYCHKVRIDHEAWQRLDEFVTKRSKVRFSHGICPECYVKIREDLGVMATLPDEQGWARPLPPARD